MDTIMVFLIYMSLYLILFSSAHSVLLLLVCFYQRVPPFAFIEHVFHYILIP